MTTATHGLTFDVITTGLTTAVGNARLADLAARRLRDAHARRDAGARWMALGMAEGLCEGIAVIIGTHSDNVYRAVRDHVAVGGGR